MGTASATRVPIVMAALLLACTSDEWPLEADEAASSSSGATWSAPPGPPAFLEVFEPVSPSIHLLGESVPLQAQVRDAEGFPVAHEEIVWSADGVGPTLLVGGDGEVELAPGVYDITATARFEDGSRLATTIGGVYVQSRFTGLYDGEVNLGMTVVFAGFPVVQRCVGPLAVRVDYDGANVEIEGGTCTLDATIAVFDVAYTLEGTFVDGVGHGTIDYDIGGLFGFSFDWVGALVEDGFLGSFSGVVPVPLVGDADATGRFDAAFRTPYLEDAP